MTYTSLIERLKADGKDTCEVEAMANAFKESGYTDFEFYQNQLYGVLVGLAIMGYITPDEAIGIMNELEAGNF